MFPQVIRVKGSRSGYRLNYLHYNLFVSPQKNRDFVVHGPTVIWWTFSKFSHLVERDLEFPLPLPHPPKEKPSTTYPKTCFHQISHRPMDRSHSQSPSTNPSQLWYKCSPCRLGVTLPWYKCSPCRLGVTMSFLESFLADISLPNILLHTKICY